MGDICVCQCHVVGPGGHFHCWDGGCPCGYENTQYLLLPEEYNYSNMDECPDNKIILDEKAYAEKVFAKIVKRYVNRSW